MPHHGGKMVTTLALLVCAAVIAYGVWRLAGVTMRLWRLGMGARGAAAALAAAIYTFSPVDAVPDVIIGIGWMDDLIVIALTALYIWRLIEQRQSSRRPGGGAIRPPRPTFIPQLPPR